MPHPSPYECDKTVYVTYFLYAITNTIGVLGYQAMRFYGLLFGVLIATIPKPWHLHRISVSHM